MSRPSSRKKGRSSLESQLHWLIGLRWVAAIAVMAASLIDYRWLRWYQPHAVQGLMLGGIVFTYNIVLWQILKWASATLPRGGKKIQFLLMLAWVQLLLDLGCLTLLTIWTGGTHSPLAGFFVFHMVCASLLLPRTMAYAGATVALAMLGAGLRLTGQWPKNHQEYLSWIGAVLTLILTVYLANHITGSLRKQRRRLIRQNKHIRAISAQLQRQHQALVQHEKMVALGQMAAGMTHEIANPLASMDSVLQLMQRRPERLRPESIVTLREQVERINQIIRQMKTFAHPAEMQRQSLPLNDIIEQSLSMVRFDSRVKRISIDKHLDPNAGSLSLLPQALQQVLVNLIINAMDAMADVEAPKLTLRTERRDGWCVIEVADNGHGIRAEHMDRLFEPFFTTKPVGKGTGLGLSISYSLVQKQGGSISVRSQPGKGTAFMIRLPAADGSRQREGASKDVLASENPKA